MVGNYYLYRMKNGRESWWFDMRGVHLVLSLSLGFVHSMPHGLNGAMSPELKVFGKRTRSLSHECVRTENYILIVAVSGGKRILDRR